MAILHIKTIINRSKRSYKLNLQLICNTINNISKEDIIDEIIGQKLLIKINNLS